MVNRAEAVALEPLTQLLPEAVGAARRYLEGKRAEWAEANAEPLRKYREQLIDFQQASLLDELPGAHREKRRQRVDATVAEQHDLLDRLETAGDPLLRVLAVLVPSPESARMSFESLTNRGEYLSAHYLAEILPTTLKGGLVKQWAEREKAGESTPRSGLRGLRRGYFDAKTELSRHRFP